MPYLSLKVFPEFDRNRLPSLFVLPAREPSEGRAQSQPRIYHESPSGRRLRYDPLWPFALLNTESHHCPLGVYVDQRRSTIYPRLTGNVKAEVASSVSGFHLNVRARHGSQQEDIGGSFEFCDYPEALIHLTAWVQFARRWMSTSWDVIDDGALSKRPDMETIDPRLLSGVGLKPTIPSSVRPELTDDPVSMRRLLRMIVEAGTTQAPSDLSRSRAIRKKRR